MFLNAYCLRVCGLSKLFIVADTPRTSSNVTKRNYKQTNADCTIFLPLFFYETGVSAHLKGFIQNKVDLRLHHFNIRQDRHSVLVTI